MVISQIMPARRHSFANLDKAKQTSPAAEGSGKKKGGRFKRWRKVSFSVGDTVSYLSQGPNQSISRSFSAGDRPMDNTRKDFEKKGKSQAKVKKPGVDEQGIAQAVASSQDTDSFQVNLYISLHKLWPSLCLVLDVE